MGCWAQGTDFCLLYQLKSCPLLTVRVPFLLYLGSFKRTVAVFGKVEAVPRFCCCLPVAEQTSRAQECLLQDLPQVSKTLLPAGMGQ